jgi:hypothetical protein
LDEEKIETFRKIVQYTKILIRKASFGQDKKIHQQQTVWEDPKSFNLREKSKKVKKKVEDHQTTKININVRVP